MVALPSQVELIDSSGDKVPSIRALSGASLWAKDNQAEFSRVLEVGKAPWMYPDIASAIAAALALPTPPNIGNRVEILIQPGLYVSNAVIDVPEGVSIVGDRFATRLRNDTTNLFRLTGDHTSFLGLLIEGSPTAELVAFECNNRSNVHIREVDMLSNGGTAKQLYLLQAGATWRTFLFERCIIDGWQLSDVLCKFQNTAGGNARDVDLHINDCFIDSLHLTGFGGGIQARKVLEFNVRGSLIRGASAFHTGVRCENGGGTGTNVLIANSYLTAGVPVFGEANTNYTLTNTDALGSLTSGTRTLRNSSV